MSRGGVWGSLPAVADEAEREGAEQGSRDPEAGDAAPRPKRKKKKRKAAEEAGGGREIPAGWPAFARTYPADAELDRLVEAFERGDHAAVRDGADRLAKGSEAEEVRRAAADLRRRVDPDPLAVMLLLASIALLVLLSAWYWSHAHAP